MDRLTVDTFPKCCAFVVSKSIKERFSESCVRWEIADGVIVGRRLIYWRRREFPAFAAVVMPVTVVRRGVVRRAAAMMLTVRA